MIIDYITELGYGSSINTVNNSITVYHGTSKGSATKINKGRIRFYPFFAFDIETAKQFGQGAVTRGKPTILTMQVALKDLAITGGYLTAQSESLYLIDGIYQSERLESQLENG